MEQLKLPTADEQFLSRRIDESVTLLKKVVALNNSGPRRPIIIPFSGGRDSMVNM